MAGNVSLHARNAASDQVKSIHETNNAVHVRLSDSAAGPEGANAGEALAVTSSSGQSAAITGTLVDVIADAVCFIELGDSPTAVTGTSYRIAADTTYRFPITSGNKLAAITATTANLWLHPVQQPSQS